MPKKIRSKQSKSRAFCNVELPAHLSRARAHARARANLSCEVTAEEVIQSLLHLLRHLGIKVSQPRSRWARADRRPYHTLYPHAAAINELLKSWHQKPEYLNGAGDPAPIKLRGPHPSFRALAQRGLRGMDESFLISELKRLGMISIDQDHWVHVHMRYFPMYTDKRLAIQHTLTALQGFINTLRHNLDSAPTNSEPLFNRIAWSGNFDSRELPALKLKLKRQGQNLLDRFDSWLSRRSSDGSRQASRSAKMTGVSIGIYLSVDTT